MIHPDELTGQTTKERGQELDGLQVGLDRPWRLPLGPQVALERAGEVVYAWLRHASRIA